MKILLLGNQKKYRGFGRGYSTYWHEELFREELGRHAEVDYYGWGYDLESAKRVSVSKAIERFGKPDVILTHYILEKHPGLGDVKGILKAHIAGDYYEGSWKTLKYRKYFETYKFDIVFGYGNIVVDQLRRDKIGMEQHLLPFTVDPHIFRNLRLPKVYDVSAFFRVKKKNQVYPLRREIQEVVKQLNLNTWTEKVFYDDVVIKTNQSKICINSNARFGFINPRVTEILSCGTFLLNSGSGEFEKLGYEDGYDLVLFDDLEDMKDKIFYFLKNESEREQIAKNGMRFVRENYTNKHRVERFLSALENYGQG